MLNREVFAGHVAQLQERSLIINTVDFNLSRDMMLEWITANFIQDLGVEVTQLKVLTKFMFSLVLEKTTDQEKILHETPLYMNGRMILAFPWEPSFDVKTISTTATLVWVDLLTLNPLFKDSALELLGQVGKVVYAASKYARSKFSNVRGCVKVDPTQPLKDFVEIGVEGIGIFKIDMDLWTISDACFYCRKRGHLMCDCDVLKKLEQEDLDHQDEEDGTFCEVKHKRQTGSPTDRAKSRQEEPQRWFTLGQ